MDGQYPSNSYPFTHSHKALIKSWIKNAIANKNWGAGLDVHVDEICKKKGRHQEFWIPLSVSLVSYANQFLQELNRTDIIGVVDIPLYANEQSIMGFNFRKLEDIRIAFGITPPSLSIYFRQGIELYNVYQDAISLGKPLIGARQFSVLAYENLLKKDYTQHVRVISLMPSDHKIELLG